MTSCSMSHAAAFKRLSQDHTKQQTLKSSCHSALAATNLASHSRRSGRSTYAHLTTRQHWKVRTTQMSEKTFPAARGSSSNDRAVATAAADNRSRQHHSADELEMLQKFLRPPAGPKRELVRRSKHCCKSSSSSAAGDAGENKVPPYASEARAAAAAAAAAFAAVGWVGADCSRCAACNTQLVRARINACRQRRPAALRQRESPTVSSWSRAVRRPQDTHDGHLRTTWRTAASNCEVNAKSIAYWKQL